MSMESEENATYHKIQRYYIRATVVPFEEDALHEFKGHRNIAAEDVPPWAYHSGTDKRTRRAVSRAINGFVNTGKGGTVYLGITDDGTARGLNLTQLQKDHVVIALDDLMSRYNPPVASHRYKVKFVPVVEPNSSDDILSKQAAVGSSNVDVERRKRPHVLRTHNYCWCDKDAVAQYNCGIMNQDYVLEITIKPWDPEDPRNQAVVKSQLKLNPFHEDEEGTVYFRRQASVMSYSRMELFNITKQEVANFYEPEIARLKAVLHTIQISG